MSHPGLLNRIFPSVLVLVAMTLGPAAMADKDKAPADPQVKQGSAADQGASDTQAGDPLKRPLEEKRRKENARSLKRELKGEYKKWIEFDSNQRTYKGGGLRPEDIETRFPNLRDKTRLDPFDPGVEFNKPRQSSSLNIVPFEPKRDFAHMPAADLPLAA